VRWKRQAAQGACFAAVVLLAQACAHAPASAPPPDPRVQLVQLEMRIFELVQAERRKIDPSAKSLALDNELIDVARAHSQDMATKRYLAHKSPNGETAADLIMNADDKWQGLLGENLAAQHFVVNRGFDVETFAHRFVDSWLASPSHKDNLAFAPYDRAGVGAAINGDTIYVTELFATDLGLPPVKDNPKTRKVTEFPDAKTAKDAPRQIAPPAPRWSQP
jgi:uncharacterized protein YkwD